jgi:hypothetical protein
MSHQLGTLFPLLPKASFEDLKVVLLIIGLLLSPFVIHDQLRRRRVRRFMARIKQQEGDSSQR